jgi:hypothetical protein
MEPVALQDLFMAPFAGAMVLLAGAAYAALFGVARVYKIPMLMPFAYLAYGMLAMAVLTLSEALRFSGPWQIITGTMLVGYLLAPHGIWHLCIGMHCGSPEEGDQGMRHQK